MAEHVDVDPSGTDAEGFRSSLAALSRLLEILYARQRVRVVLRQSSSIDGVLPEILPSSVAIGPDRTGPDYLGAFDVGTDGAEPPPITVFAYLPRPPGPEERNDQHHSWRDRSRVQRMLFKISPLALEVAKYAYERHSRHRSRTKHRWTSLPRGTALRSAENCASIADEKKPAILIGFHWLEVGGAENLAMDTVRWALAAGLRVLIVVDKPGLQRMAARLPEHPDVELLHTHLFLPRAFWPAFVEALIRKENIRAIHIHHATGLYDSLAHVKAVFPETVVIDSTHIIEHQNGGYPRISGVWSNYIDHHHVISEELATLFRDRFSVSEKILLGRLLSLDRKLARSGLPRLRMEAGQKEYTITFVGRMVHQKRPFVMLEIARTLHAWARRAGISLRFEIVGTGPYLEGVASLVNRYRLTDMVTFHPADADIRALLGRSDVLVLPSGNEGLALVCYEALENGAIPISTDVGGQRELIPVDLLVHPNPLRTVRETVALIRRLAEDGSFLDRCKTGLAERHGKLASEPTAEEVLMPIYRAVAAGGPAR